jgi:hypothetical protein
MTLQRVPGAEIVTKREAARLLDVSTKTIEQLDKEGTLPGRLYRRPDGGPKVRVYERARALQLAAERRPVRPVTVLGPASGGLAPVVAEGADPVALAPRPVVSGELVALLEWLQSQKSASTSASAEKSLVLTLEDAAAVSGWSVGFLRRARADGRLRADRDRWRGPDGKWHVGWKIRRTDLEAL